MEREPLSMTPDEIQAFVHRYVEYVQAHDAEALARCFATDATVESPSIGTHQGRRAIAEGYRGWFASFPDLHWNLEGIVADASEVSLAFRASGTHQDEFLGLPATGKRVEFRGVYLQTVRDDHIVRERRVYDFTGFLIKLGILTSQADVALSHTTVSNAKIVCTE